MTTNGWSGTAESSSPLWRPEGQSQGVVMALASLEAPGNPCLPLPLPGSGGCGVPCGSVLAASAPSSRACPLGISLLPLIRTLPLGLGPTQICQGDLILIS